VKVGEPLDPRNPGKTARPARWRWFASSGAIFRPTREAGSEPGRRDGGLRSANPPYGKSEDEITGGGEVCLGVEPLVPSAPGQQVVRANQREEDPAEEPC